MEVEGDLTAKSVGKNRNRSQEHSHTGFQMKSVSEEGFICSMKKRSIDGIGAVWP